MQPHEQRIVDEKTALDEKIEKLETFIIGDKFRFLSGRNQELLGQQLKVMAEYSDILDDRIQLFVESPAA